MNSICTKVPIRRPLLQAVAVLGITAGLLAGSPSPSWAGTVGPPVPDTDGTSGGTCMVEKFRLTKPSANATDLNCTSNDVQLAQYTVVQPGPTECFEGQDVTLTLQGEFVATSDQRWDVGVFIHENGGTPNSLPSSADDTCYSDYLHPVSADNTDLNLIGGAGPFYNGEISEDPTDTCGDIEQGENAFFNTAEITVVCQDDNNDGNADVGTCTVWANSRSSGEPGNPSCIDQDTSYDNVNGTPPGPTPGGGSPQGVTAETTAKCTCGNVEIAGLTVLKFGNLEVVKEVLPEGFVYTDDSFDLQIDDVTEKDDAQDGDTTGTKIVSAGSSSSPGADHTVGEIAGTDTDLANYVTSIECVDRGTTDVRASSFDSGPLTVNVQPNNDIVCTITNELKLGMVSVTKTVSGGPIPNDGTSFTFEVRTGADLDNLGDIVESDTIAFPETEIDFLSAKLNPGDYQFCESGMMPGWDTTLDDGGFGPAFVPGGNLPNPDNSTICVNFTLDPDETESFVVDNTPPPGGDARTIGFWKNWTSCDGHGNQDPVLDDNLPVSGYLGTLVGTSCEVAVDLLDKRDIGNPDEVRDGKKRAGDAAYGLAAQLLAAQLNLNAGAGVCQEATDAIIAGDALLASINFDGTGSYLRGGKNEADKTLANELAGILDDYNNNELCNP